MEAFSQLLFPLPRYVYVDKQTNKQNIDNTPLVFLNQSFKLVHYMYVSIFHFYSFPQPSFPSLPGPLHLITISVPLPKKEKKREVKC